MNLISNAAIDLLRRESPELVAATGLFYRSLQHLYPERKINELLILKRNGIWGNETLPGTGYPVLRSTNMRGAKVDTDNPAWCEINQEKATTYILQDGDILVTKSSGSTDLVGKACLFKQPGDDASYLFSNFTLLLRPQAEQIHPAYLAWFLRSPQALSWRYNSQLNAVGLRNLQTEDYLSQLIPLPPFAIQESVVQCLDALELGDPMWRNSRLPDPLPEQQRIVARIEELAGRIAEAKSLRSQSDSSIGVFAASTRAATFRSLLRKKQVKLTDLAELERGRFSHRPRNEPRFFGGEHPWIQIGEIENAGKHITHYSQTLNNEGLAISRKFAAGTVLISIAATIGAAGILAFDCCVPDSVVGMTPRQGVNGEYLYHFICHARDHLEQIAPESARKNINLRILSDLRVPELNADEQADVVESLDSAEDIEDRLKRESDQSRKILYALLPSILDKAFRGEI